MRREQEGFGTALSFPLLAAGAGLSLFQLFQASLGSLGDTWMLPIHLTWILALAFFADAEKATTGRRRVSLALSVLAVAFGIWVLGFDRQSVAHILNGLRPLDLIAGVALLLILLEAVRRRVGAVMAGIVALALLYNLFGAELPGALSHRGFSPERITRFQIFTGAGLFGLPLSVASGTVFVFVLFGALLEATGAGRFFIHLAYAIAGRFRGGPAKAAVVASAAMGSVSGSAIANTVTTGALTIPMMKRLGYSPAQAAGIEAAASTGGQLTPPIMGAGAFLMAELTGAPYPRIVLVSILPALLFFAGTLLFVHGFAARRGLRAMEERPRFGATLAEGAHFLLAIAAVVVLLAGGYSPPLVGTAGCVAMVLASLLRKSTRIGPRQILDGLARGALTAVPVSLACAAAGVVVGVMGQTGVALQFAEFVLGAAGGALLPALGLSAAAALFLGMGLPVTAAYIVVAVVAGPALTGLGLPLLTAHLILFWLSQTSNVTPPIALAAFAGAGVAGARPMAAAAEAARLSLGLFLVPLLMAYTPLLPESGSGIEGEQLLAFGSGLLAIASAAIALCGHGLSAAGFLNRLLLLAAALLLVFPAPGLRLVGAGIAVAGLLPQLPLTGSGSARDTARK